MTTAADILRAARDCDFALALAAFRAANNDGDGYDPDGDDLGVLVGEQDGIAVYDDAGDAVLVADDEWAVRIYGH